MARPPRVTRLGDFEAGAVSIRQVGRSLTVPLRSTEAGHEERPVANVLGGCRRIRTASASRTIPKRMTRRQFLCHQETDAEAHASRSQHLETARAVESFRVRIPHDMEGRIASGARRGTAVVDQCASNTPTPHPRIDEERVQLRVLVVPRDDYREPHHRASDFCHEHTGPASICSTGSAMASGLCNKASRSPEFPSDARR